MTRREVRILIAPDKFKGTLSARSVAENIGRGIAEILPAVKIDLAPMADGGEGTAEAICDSLGGQRVACPAHDPLDRPIEARYAWIADSKKAIMEMSEAAGVRRLRPRELNPEIATTFGVGEMILNASLRGAREIILGLGGSATNDGGFGLARALGFKFDFDGDQRNRENVIRLIHLQNICKPEELNLPRIIAAVDVQNPLLGESGATRIFGPQKGASSEQIVQLEQALTRLADVVARQFGFDPRDQPGAGAAGGLGFGLISFCGAKIRRGFEVVSESVDLKSKIIAADIVITGEGSLDAQTLAGKTAFGVAHLARSLGKKVFALVGRFDGNKKVSELFDGIYQNAVPGMSEQENMSRAAELLRQNARELAKNLNKESGFKRPTPDSK